MNRTRLKFLLLSVHLLQCTESRAQGNAGGLLAAPYPGAVAESNPAAGNARPEAVVSARSGTFYAKGVGAPRTGPPVLQP